MWCVATPKFQGRHGWVLNAQWCSHPRGCGFWGAGLPEEVAHTKQALARGYAVLAVSSLDRVMKCWNWWSDNIGVASILSDFKEEFVRFRWVLVFSPCSLINVCCWLVGRHRSAVWWVLRIAGALGVTGVWAPAMAATHPLLLKQVLGSGLAVALSL